MSTSATPPGPKPAGDSHNPAPGSGHPVEPGFEEHLRGFWERNSGAVTAVLVAVLLGIAAKGGWEYLQAQREQEVEKAYSAATTPLQLKAFVAAHSKHPLAGVAQLRVADEAYADGKFTDAIAPYEQAAATLEKGPLASRARLGLAMAKLQSGRTAEGEAALKAVAADANETKAFRAEAAYHLASLAFAQGKPEEVKTYAEQLTQIDPASPWVQRVMALRTLPAAGEPADGAGGIKLPGAGK